MASIVHGQKPLYIVTHDLTEKTALVSSLVFTISRIFLESIDLVQHGHGPPPKKKCKVLASLLPHTNRKRSCRVFFKLCYNCDQVVEGPMQKVTWGSARLFHLWVRSFVGQRSHLTRPGRRQAHEPPIAGVTWSGRPESEPRISQSALGS